jgi:hypothetical protein
MTPQIQSDSYSDRPRPVKIDDLADTFNDDEYKDYSVTENDPQTGSIRLTERYRKRLSQDTGAYVVALTRRGLEREAVSTANCHGWGTVYKRCPSGHLAVAYHNRCHDPGCRTCAKGHYRLASWLSSRDITRIISEPQAALELTMPRQGAMQEDRERMMRLSAKLLNRLGCDAISHDVINPNSGIVTLRVMLKGLAPSWRYTVIAREWKSIGGASACCSLRHIAAGEPVKHAFATWLFSGLEPMSLLPGDLRAEVRLALRRCRFVRTMGSFYSPLAKEDLEAYKKAHRAHQDSEECPKCHDGTLLETIPVERRVMVQAEQIEESYPIVIWRPELPCPFEIRRSARLIDKGRWFLMDKSQPITDSVVRLSRYGPN